MRWIDLDGSLRFGIEVKLTDASAGEDESVNFSRLDHRETHIAVFGNIHRRLNYMPIHVFDEHRSTGAALI